MIKIVQLDGPLKNLSHATKQLISPYSITTHYLYEITYSRLLRNYKLVKTIVRADFIKGVGMKKISANPEKQLEPPIHENCFCGDPTLPRNRTRL